MALVTRHSVTCRHQILAEGHVTKQDSEGTEPTQEAVRVNQKAGCTHPIWQGSVAEGGSFCHHLPTAHYNPEKHEVLKPPVNDKVINLQHIRNSLCLERIFPCTFVTLTLFERMTRQKLVGTVCRQEECNKNADFTGLPADA